MVYPYHQRPLDKPDPGEKIKDQGLILINYAASHKASVVRLTDILRTINVYDISYSVLSLASLGCDTRE